MVDVSSAGPPGVVVEVWSPAASDATLKLKQVFILVVHSDVIQIMST